jgi:hypothetical protein
MIIKVDIGGVMVSFGTPGAPVRPEPFYPYLLSVGSIQDNRGDETGNAEFLLHLKAKPLIWINLRRKVQMLTDELEVVFEGYIGRVSYNEGINVTVET